jgi:5-methyltetrahydropteroyltriglutamate--homocysteine methyltransferase
LRHLPKSKSVVLGLVSSKTPVLESKDEIKRRIDAAARHVDLDRLALSPQCGFSSGGGSGQTVSRDDERRKLQLVLDVAHDVWGSN